ncbi:MAG: triose-phosphate isomerase, partial [Elusimicrobia bacterium]|nr:triose-phosphate isomerase [Elusimicrobiota bacterium]
MSEQNSSQRRALVAANWKMYKTPAEAEAFLNDFLPKLPADLPCDVVLCPPFIALPTVAARLRGSHVGLG